ncbi:MFS general substrate transporter-23 [Coleophoma crateriformis]|uniref:MFS general substrate transporter-23 n=1 Tax=Coleophoma crateriformis TaxID=565419 RepID=A0A3D8RVG5_9HELO|nr:MFS general substrate transporter-23 [Coleophoma crateriformis]
MGDLKTDPEDIAVTAAAPPEPPYSIFTTWQKVLIVTIVSLAATFSSFSGNIYYPALPAIALDLEVSAELVNLTVTSYMIFQGLAPTLWGAIADVHGRRLTYILTMVIFFAACVGLAETRSFAQLLVLRCLQSTGSASTIAIGAGVIGDITRREERGGYMGIFLACLLIPNAAGPILGGVFAATLGWRAIFWFLAIYSGAFLVGLVFLLPETLRSLVGNGSIPPRGAAKSLLSYINQRRLDRLSRQTDEDGLSRARSNTASLAEKKKSMDFLGPLRLIFGVEVSCAIFYLAIYYTGWQMTISSMSTLFSRAYGISDLDNGLTFVGNGVGCIFGTLTTGRLLDFQYRRLKKNYTGDPLDFPLEKARFQTLWIWNGLECASVIGFGWAVDQRVHISVPIICSFVLGWSTTSLQSIVTTFMVDVFPDRSASAVAALNLARCLMCAGGISGILPLVNAIGVGWAYTLITAVLFLASGLMVIQTRFGARWRRRREEGKIDTTT